MAMAGEKVKTEGACDTIDAETQELHETAWGWGGHAQMCAGIGVDESLMMETPQTVCWWAGGFSFQGAELLGPLSTVPHTEGQTLFSQGKLSARAKITFASYF